MPINIPDKLKESMRTHVIVSTIVRLSFLGVLIASVFEMNYLLAFVSAFMIFATFLPSIITRKYRILLPPEFEIMLSIFLYASFILGEMKSYYFRYWWWDVMLHSFAAFMLGLIGFIIVYTFHMTHRIRMSPLFISVFSFCFSLSIGALWEIVEFIIDTLFGTNMQKTGLLDTMIDLIVDALGALTAAVLGFLYIKSGQAYILKGFVERFLKMNKRFVKKAR